MLEFFVCLVVVVFWLVCLATQLCPTLVSPGTVAHQATSVYGSKSTWVGCHLLSVGGSGVLGPHCTWHVVCEALVLPPGLNSCPTVEAQSLNHWTAREVPGTQGFVWHFYNSEHWKQPADPSIKKRVNKFGAIHTKGCLYSHQRWWCRVVVLKCSASESLYALKH